MVFEEKTLDSERIYEGKIINLRKDKVTVKSGTSYREIIEHRGAAVIAALTDDNEMVMVKQFRKPAEKVLLEVPAGKIDPGEDPMDTAIREMKEETGYEAEKVEYLMKFYPAVGYSEEILHLYLFRGLRPGETNFDENEAIETELYPVDQLYKMAMAGEIEDGKTLIAILTVKSLLQQM